MRKRLLVLMLCGMALMTACQSKKDNKPEDEIEVDDEDEEEEEDDEDDDKVEPDDKDNEDDDKDKPEESEKTLQGLTVLYDQQQAWFVDENGEFHELFSMDDEGLLVKCNVVDDNIFAIYETWGENYHTGINVYDKNGKQIYEYIPESPGYETSVEKYDDKIMIAYQWYDNNDPTFTALEFDPVNLTFTHNEELEALGQKARNNSLNWGRYDVDIFEALNNDSENIYVYDTDGKEFRELDRDTFDVVGTVAVNSDIAIENFSYINACGDYLILDTYDDNFNYRKYVVNAKTGDTVPADEKFDKGNIIEKEDDHFYFYLPSSNFKTGNNEVYRFYPETNKSEFVYSIPIVPCGALSSIVSGVSGFYRAGDRIYFETTDEEGAVWRYFDTKTDSISEPVFRSTRLEYADFMRVEGSEGKSMDSSGKVVVYEYYNEKPIIKDSIPGAAKINEQLDTMYNNRIIDAYTVPDDDVEYIQQTGPYTSEFNVVGGKLLGSRYLTIEMSGYDYWGGAHGMGYNEYLLFDRNTGEQLHLADICGVDEDTFRRILAAKTLESWKTSDQFYVDEYETEADIFEMIYDDSSFTSWGVCFEDDHITVEYPPYMYGPYAAGFITIDIGYDELNMDINR